MRGRGARAFQLHAKSIVGLAPSPSFRYARYVTLRYVRSGHPSPTNNSSRTTNRTGLTEPSGDPRYSNAPELPFTHTHHSAAARALMAV